jgi:hypothetical protein
MKDAPILGALSGSNESTESVSFAFQGVKSHRPEKDDGTLDAAIPGLTWRRQIRLRAPSNLDKAS